jgi:membrane fusion protein (multidrug efflux system)
MWFNKRFVCSLKGTLVLSLMLAGLLLSPGCDRREQSQGQSAAHAPVPEVIVLPVSFQQIVLTSELPGRTAASRVAEIRPQVNGLVQKRLFEEGSVVRAGQVLYQIDPASFQAGMDAAGANLSVAAKAVDRARAALDMSIAGISRQQAILALAQINHNRAEELARVNAVPASERDKFFTELKVARASLASAEAQVRSDREALAGARAVILQAEAALQTARINLGYCRITAPIDGRIGRSAVTEGAIVTAYQPAALAVIQQLDPIYVDVPQAVTELLHLRRRVEDGSLNSNGTNQNRVRLVLEDGMEYPAEGVLQFQDITVDPTTGSVILRILFPNPNHLLMPGMFVQALIREGVKERAILIPQQSVARDAKGNPFSLIVTDDGRVEMRMLTLDRAIGDQWLIASGLEPGDRVMVEGMLKVRPGAAVKPVLSAAIVPEQGIKNQARTGAPQNGGE